jgi:hypothetical protein
MNAADALAIGISTMATYPPVRNRNDMTAGQYIKYASDWALFQRVWAINYQLSTIGSGQRYIFANYDEFNSYLRGQISCIDVYDSNSPGRILSTIRAPKILASPSQFVNIA